MTSRQRFEAEFKRLGGDSVDLRTTGADYFYTDTARAFGLWQAAERDMLERCVKAAKNERLTDNTDEPTDVAYNTAISHVVYKLKELLNEQH